MDTILLVKAHSAWAQTQQEKTEKRDKEWEKERKQEREWERKSEKEREGETTFLRGVSMKTWKSNSV